MRSERLVYRRPTPSDLVNLHHLDNDPDVMQWINGGEPVSVERFTQELLPVYLSVADGPFFGFWILEVSGEFIGWVSLRPGDKPLSGFLGYRLRRSAWGKGYATEAAGRILELAFIEAKLERVTAQTYESNVGSQHVLAKIGMKLQRRFRMNEEALSDNDTSVNTGELWALDDLEFGITAAEFC